VLVRSSRRGGGGVTGSSVEIGERQVSDESLRAGRNRGISAESMEEGMGDLVEN
jgi:hypothetical protein